MTDIELNLGQRQFDQAILTGQADWDRYGDTSVHLPTEVAKEFLRRAGWTVPEFRQSPLTPPEGIALGDPVYEIDEAMFLTLVAATAEVEDG